MRATRQIAAALLELVIPSTCLGCPRTGAGRLNLCPVCRGRLVRLRPPLCDGCARPLGDPRVPFGYRCGRCRVRRPAVDRLMAIWSYRPPFDRVIRGLKYHRLEYLGAHLAAEIVRQPVELPAAEVLVPVPLHWRRRLVRGYNQAEAIARPLARRLGLPLVDALARRRATPPQARLTLDRATRVANLRQAFRARSGTRVRGLPVLLVDDVVTTGATLAAAARALKAAGAGPVFALAAGRTPEPGT